MKTRNMRRLFFHEESIHEVSRRYLEHEYTHTHTDKPKPICPPLFQSWGHNYDQYKKARNLVISELRKAKYYHEKDLATKIKTNSKLFWGYMRSKLKTKSAIGQLEATNGMIIDNNQERATF